MASSGTPVSVAAMNDFCALRSDCGTSTPYHLRGSGEGNPLFGGAELEDFVESVPSPGSSGVEHVSILSSAVSLESDVGSEISALSED